MVFTSHLHEVSIYQGNDMLLDLFIVAFDRIKVRLLKKVLLYEFGAIWHKGQWPKSQKWVVICACLLNLFNEHDILDSDAKLALFVVARLISNRHTCL